MKIRGILLLFFALALIFFVSSVFLVSLRSTEKENLSLFGKYQLLLAQEGAKRLASYLRSLYSEVYWLGKFLEQKDPRDIKGLLEEAGGRLSSEEKGVLKEIAYWRKEEKYIYPESRESSFHVLLNLLVEKGNSLPTLYNFSTPEGFRRLVLSIPLGEAQGAGVFFDPESLYLKFFHFLRLGKGTRVVLVDEKGKILLSPIYTGSKIQIKETVIETFPMGASIKRGEVTIGEKKFPPSIIASIPMELFGRKFWVLSITPEEEARGIPLSMFRYSLTFTLLAIGFIVLGFYSFWERMKLAERHYQMSITDGLTGLHNHHCFYTVLPREIRRAERYSRPLSLIMIDLDGFKKYNDSHGHLEGDRVLREVGNILRKCLREDVDMIFRYGGDEFAVVLPETSLEEAEKVAERIKEKFTEKDRFGFTLSMGIAQHQKGWEAEDLVREADKLLYEAKRKGGNIYVSGKGSLS